MPIISVRDNRKNRKKRNAKKKKERKKKGELNGFAVHLS